MIPARRAFVALFCGGLLAACTPSAVEPGAFGLDSDPLAPGGTHLTFALDSAAAWPPPELIEHAPAFDPGRRLFYRNWLSVTRAGRPLAGPGLDDATCAGCHIDMARPGDRTLDYDPLLIARPIHEFDRLALGEQIHRFRVDGRPPAASVRIDQASIGFTYPDGTRRTLQFPVARATTSDGRAFPVALRAAPLLFGWGLLERIDPDMLAHFHDPQDRNGDGVSGRMARVNEHSGGEPAIGLLGWKGGHADLRAQIRAALAHDMGVIGPPDADPGCSGAGAKACRTEISNLELEALTGYVRNIGVPQRRSGASRRGQNLFGQAGCAQCHVPALQTLPAESPALDAQWAWAFTDLMLHDMGAALADPGDASDAREWRTAPLWGVGLAEKWLPERGFLHDGRARTLEEAVLWHGGEARSARDAFAAMPVEDRRALIEFVRAL